IIGMPKEIKNNEYRVAMVPSSVMELCRHGHTVYVEHNAGSGAGFTDTEYKTAGAILCDAATIYERAEMVYKVKEVLPQEFGNYHEGQILFTYIHSENRPEMTADLVNSKIVGISYEDVTNDEGKLPLLQPMSEIAGKGGFINAFTYMQTIQGGGGKLLSRVCGLESPNIMIIGCGGTGMAAAEYAAALGNHVTMLDINRTAMEDAQHRLPANVEIVYSNRTNVLKCIDQADVIMNCVLWDHRRSDHIVYTDDLKRMKSTAIIVDIASDDAGAIETCHMTTHDDPVYRVNGILHYCVPNIPSLYAYTASILLSSATLPYALQIADKGVRRALKENKHLRNALTFWYGDVTWKETADMHGYPYVSPDDIVSGF
ncbi:MAG TPA: alanine dehydrogenase, partial [Negativicutes bacterium]|nr:alanine dehydrogenase [Negativicutes bacterium]